MKVPLGKFTHFIGIDPSSNDKKCGYCRIRPDGTVEEVFAGPIQATSFTKGQLVAVEKPEYRKYGRANPDDIMTLTMAAGALMERAARAGATVCTPTPSEWTSVTKSVRQRRAMEETKALSTLNKLRLEQLERTTPKTYLADAMDALCIAFWLLEQHTAVANIRSIVEATRARKLNVR